MSSKHGVGVAISVKKCIKANKKQYLYNTTDLKFIVVKVDSPVGALIADVYRPPDYSVQSFL